MLADLVKSYFDRVASLAFSRSRQLAEVIANAVGLIDALKNVIEPSIANDINTLLVTKHAQQFLDSAMSATVNIEYDFILSIITNALAGCDLEVEKYRAVTKVETAKAIAATLVHAMVHDSIQGTKHTDKFIENYVKSGIFTDNGVRLKMIKLIYEKVRGECR